MNTDTQTSFTRWLFFFAHYVEQRSFFTAIVLPFYLCSTWVILHKSPPFDVCFCSHPITAGGVEFSHVCRIKYQIQQNSFLLVNKSLHEQFFYGEKSDLLLFEIYTLTGPWKKKSGRLSKITSPPTLLSLTAHRYQISVLYINDSHYDY